ncbi:NlpC/P60 family protein [Kouleothrix sp.]|uniref:C40 family peptidase n=1 Tax=Kouleothrix sp. TaxID=2779161 RepID=UPI00391C58F7
MIRVSSPRACALAAAALLLAAPLLACLAGANITPIDAGQSPSWACPSPTPLPFGAAGPLKDVIEHPRPTLAPAGPIEYDREPVYYAEWEQEYGAQAGGPPFPSPTPYALTGASYAFGQRVSVPPLFATVSAEAGQPLAGDRQLYRVLITWNNPSGAPLPIDYAAQVRLRALERPDGRVLAGDGWAMSPEALALAGLSAPGDTIAPGESHAIVPIVAPAGAPQTAELLFVRGPLAGGAPADPAATPTPNSELRRAPDQQLAVQWSSGGLSIGPPCGDPGAMTGWQGGPGAAWGHADLPVAAPPGAARVVQLALNQVGKRYVWGAEGPETFDCSGLVRWAYAQAGITLRRTAQQQHDSLRTVAAAALQPGDLVFFAKPNRPYITHVAMVIGDADGDGTLDVVHAMSPALGVRVTHNLLGSAYYSGGACQLCIAGFATVR